MADPVGTLTPPIGKVGQNYGYSVGKSGTGDKGIDTVADKDMFLKLLVAQMKYQDPSKPTDASQFLAQTAQFTLVEKMGQLATAQAEMTSANQLQAATSLVGTTVTWSAKDKDGATVNKSGVVDAVTIKGGVPSLSVGTDTLALSDVTKVTPTPVTPVPKTP
jgi:flagellar basal-body rod modification protein FlgD